MSIDVSRATLDAIATTLSTASGDLEGTGTSAPTSIDAGVMSPFVNSLVSRLCDGAAGVAEGLTVAATGVRDNAAVYGEVDLAVQSGFKPRVGGV